MAGNLSTKWLKVSQPSAHVLHVELNRTPVNAFNTQFWQEYGALFDNIADTVPDARVVVLSSAIPKLFTAGLDITETSMFNDTAADPARRAWELRRHIVEFQQAVGAPERCPIPVIVAVHGLVLGLGIDIMGYCDVRYTASNASFSIKEVDIGLAADIGTLATLPKATGNQSLLNELAFSTKQFSAAEAEKLGFVSKVVPGGRDEVVAEALTLAQTIASKSPYAVASTKHLLLHSRDHT
ncbi:hypothetical protein HGRIS_014400 [Hohenbuehelia grisea]|uniref:Uncharacterized protein n=1 Tax=Hohenbuehelia grisea TaxID=104357 RepID=A0ABR3JTE9_9AGAR